MAATTALREALNQGISDSSGRVCRLKALYANSHILKTVPYFNDRESTATLDATRLGPHRVVQRFQGSSRRRG
ncbi:hypothetical protein BDM02DRAFT_3112835, partial [Thelephora ganbajun]